MSSCPGSGAPTARVLLFLVLAGAPTLDAQAAPERLTLRQAIELALRQGYEASAAQATRDAARYRHRAFNARLLPQLSVGGTVPRYNRSIIPVLQPDGSTLFRAQNATTGAMSASGSPIRPIGFCSSSFAAFSGLARQNLSFSDDVLSVVGEPLRVRSQVIDGGTTSLNSFAVALAVAVSIMFITVLLAAGALALEREGRRARGPAGKVRPQRDLDRGGIGDAPDVREHAAGAHLFGEVLEVAVERRQRGRAVEEGLLGRVRGRVPGAQAEAGEVQQVEHLRHVALPHQRGIGLEQQVVEQHGLAEIEQGAAHGS